MKSSYQHIAIIGGGTAGWLCAAVIAAKHRPNTHQQLQITLVESKDVPTVGVGEGTWPTMKNTLHAIGLSEKEVFRHCKAAFKQGGKFVGWVDGQDAYYHPFTLPLGYGRIELAPYVNNIAHFAEQTNFQYHICEAGLGPRTLAEPEYQGQCNYAYHLDAGAFADLLKKHCKQNLGVTHQVATVKHVHTTPTGDISEIHFEQQCPPLKADLYIDCSGFQSLLLGQALKVPFKSCKEVLFNDRALVTRIPYPQANSPLATHTLATAQATGWIWDIGVTDRRGVGYVYSSEHIDDNQAEQVLQQYTQQQHDTEIRSIGFQSGHRERFWQNNCVAVGLAAGFVEPLEATAILLIELSARFIANNLPVNDEQNQLIAQRFNQQMSYRWQRIIDFLKLHYMLSHRPEPYWRDHCSQSSIPQSLLDDLKIWQYRGPVVDDFDSALELFPAASYQYVLYGMGFKPDFSQQAYLYDQTEQAKKILNRNQLMTQQLLDRLPSHRNLINQWLNQQPVMQERCQ